MVKGLPISRSETLKFKHIIGIFHLHKMLYVPIKKESSGHASLYQTK